MFFYLPGALVFHVVAVRRVRARRARRLVGGVHQKSLRYSPPPHVIGCRKEGQCVGAKNKSSTPQDTELSYVQQEAGKKKGREDDKDEKGALKKAKAKKVRLDAYISPSLVAYSHCFFAGEAIFWKMI